MRLIIALLVTLVFLSIISYGQELRVTFWHSFAPKSPRGKALQYLVDNFNNSKYQVNGKTIFVESVYKGGNGKYNNPYNVLFSELLKASYQGDTPNVSIAYENWVSQLQEIGVIQDFDSFKSDKILDYFNSLYSDFRNSSIINGKIYSLSFNKSLFCFYYNSSYVDNIPTDFEKFMAKLEEIKQTKNVVPLYLEPNEDTFIILYLLSVSEKFFTIDSKIYPNFLGKNLDSTTNLIKNLVDKGLIQWTTNSYKDFIENRAPIILSTTSRYVDIKSRSNNYFISPLPADNGKIYAAGTNLILFKSTYEKELASIKFIEYLIDSNNLEYFCTNTGYIIPTYNYTQSYMQFLNSNVDYKKVIEYSRERLYVQQPIWAWENIRYFLADYMLNVFIQKNSIEQVSQDLQNKVNQIMLNQNLKFEKGKGG